MVSRILKFKGLGGLSGADLSALAAVIIDSVIGAVRLADQRIVREVLLIKHMHVIRRRGLGDGVFNGHLIRASLTNGCGVAVDISLERFFNSGETVAVIGFQRNSDRILRVRLEYRGRSEPNGADDRVLLRLGGHCLRRRFTGDGALYRCDDTRDQYTRLAQPGNVLDLRFAAGEAGQKPLAALRLCGLLGHGAGVPVVAPRRRCFAPLHGFTALLTVFVTGVAAVGAGRGLDVLDGYSSVADGQGLAVGEQFVAEVTILVAGVTLRCTGGRHIILDIRVVAVFISGPFARHDTAAGAALEVAGVAPVGAVRLDRSVEDRDQRTGVLLAAGDGVAHLKDLAAVHANLIAGVAVAGTDNRPGAHDLRAAGVGADGKLSRESQLTAAVNAHGRKGGNGAAPGAVSVFADRDRDGLRHAGFAAVIGVIRRPAGALLPVNLLRGQGQLVAGGGHGAVDRAVYGGDQHIGGGPLYRFAVLVRPFFILRVLAVQTLAPHMTRTFGCGIIRDPPRFPAVLRRPGLGAAGHGAHQRMGQRGAVGFQIRVILLCTRHGALKIVFVLLHIDLVAAFGTGVAVIGAELSGLRVIRIYGGPDQLLIAVAVVHRGLGAGVAEIRHVVAEVLLTAAAPVVALGVLILFRFIAIIGLDIDRFFAARGHILAAGIDVSGLDPRMDGFRGVAVLVRHHAVIRVDSGAGVAGDRDRHLIRGGALAVVGGEWIRCVEHDRRSSPGYTVPLIGQSLAVGADLEGDLVVQPMQRVALLGIDIGHLGVGVLGLVGDEHRCTLLEAADGADAILVIGMICLIGNVSVLIAQAAAVPVVGFIHAPYVLGLGTVGADLAVLGVDRIQMLLKVRVVDAHGLIAVAAVAGGQGFAAEHAPQLALTGAGLALIRLTEAGAAVLAEVVLVIRVLHAHAVGAVGVVGAAVRAQVAQLALVHIVKAVAAEFAEMLLKLHGLHAVFAAGAVAGVPVILAARLAQAALEAELRFVQNDAPAALLANLAAVGAVGAVVVAVGLVAAAALLAVEFAVVGAFIALAAVHAQPAHAVLAFAAGLAEIIVAINALVAVQTMALFFHALLTPSTFRAIGSYFMARATAHAVIFSPAGRVGALFGAIAAKAHISVPMVVSAVRTFHAGLMVGKRCDAHGREHPQHHGQRQQQTEQLACSFFHVWFFLLIQKDCFPARPGRGARGLRRLYRLSRTAAIYCSVTEPNRNASIFPSRLASLTFWASSLSAWSSTRMTILQSGSFCLTLSRIASRSSNIQGV